MDKLFNSENLLRSGEQEKEIHAESWMIPRFMQEKSDDRQEQEQMSPESKFTRRQTDMGIWSITEADRLLLDHGYPPPPRSFPSTPQKNSGGRVHLNQEERRSFSVSQAIGMGDTAADMMHREILFGSSSSDGDSMVVNVNWRSSSESSDEGFRNLRVSRNGKGCLEQYEDRTLLSRVSRNGKGCLEQYEDRECAMGGLHAVGLDPRRSSCLNPDAEEFKPYNYYRDSYTKLIEEVEVEEVENGPEVKFGGRYKSASYPGATAPSACKPRENMEVDFVAENLRELANLRIMDAMIEQNEANVKGEDNVRRMSPFKSIPIPVDDSEHNFLNNYQYWAQMEEYEGVLYNRRSCSEDIVLSRPLSLPSQARARRNVDLAAASSYCTFCKNNARVKAEESGEALNESIYAGWKHHTLKDPITKIVTCPVLRKYVCEICKETGDKAHTKRYCPKLHEERFKNGSAPGSPEH